MFILKSLIVLGAANFLLVKSWPQSEESSEELSSQGPGAKGTSCPCGWTNKVPKHGRIVGGKGTDPHEFPYMVAMYEMKKRKVVCGGSILTKRHILTAAHCSILVDNHPIVVVVGTHDITNLAGAQLIDIKGTFTHKGYDDETFANDVAVLLLLKSIEFSQTVGPICLPPEPPKILYKFVRVTGWGSVDPTGTVYPNRLRKVNLRVVDMDRCKVYKVGGKAYSEEKQICTHRSGMESCQGDSGGPVVWLDPETNRLTQVGIVSYGFERCAEGIPAMNTNVFAYLRYIRAVISSSSKKIGACFKVKK